MPISIRVHPDELKGTPSPVLVDPAPPAGALRDLAEDVLAGLKFRTLAVAANVDEAHADDPIAGYLKSRPTDVRAAFAKRASALLKGGPVALEAHVGRYAHVDPSQARKVAFEELADVVDHPDIDAKALNKAIGAASHGLLERAHGIKISPSDAKKMAEAADARAGAKYKKLGLFVRTVRCVSETPGGGEDEIAMGGVASAADGVNSWPIDQFMVSSHFVDDEHPDDGEVRQVDYPLPGRRFTEWNLITESGGFPYAYTALVALCEKDDGGFHDFIMKLWKQVGEAVKKAVAGAVGAAIGAAIGATFAGVGAIAGAVVGFIIGELVDWLIDLGQGADDVLGVKTLQLWLGAATKSYYDATGLTVQYPTLFPLEYGSKHGHFHYTVHCRWKLYS